LKDNIKANKDIIDSNKIQWVNDYFKLADKEGNPLDAKC